MKNFYLIILSILIISCGGGSEESKLPDITITTSSSEAKDAYLESMKLYDLRRQVSVEKRKSLLNKAIALDPDFLLAKATLYSFLGTEFNNAALKNVYEEREKVSDMEAKIIEFLYNDRTNPNPEVSSYNITMLTDEYPELWRLWYWSGLHKSYNPGEVYDAIDDLETALEINPDHFGSKLMLMAKHLQFGPFGNTLPAGEIDLDYLKTMVDDVEENHADNSYTHIVVGNYYRTLSQFDKAIDSYNKLEGYQNENERNLTMSNHYRALANTFKGDFDEAAKFFRRNFDYGGNVFGVYNFFPQLYLFKNDFDAAIDLLQEFDETIISSGLPAQEELNLVVGINRLKFLCYAHSQLEEESLKHIELTREAQINVINLRKNRLTENEYNNQINFTNYVNESFLIWHDILFGNYAEAKSKLLSYEESSKKIERPDNMHNYYVLNALVELNLGNPEKSIEFFNMTNKFNGIGQVPLNDDYYTYFKGLALVAAGKKDEGQELFKEIASKNFYGIQSALVRNLATSQL